MNVKTHVKRFSVGLALIGSIGTILYLTLTYSDIFENIVLAIFAITLTYCIGFVSLNQLNNS